MPAVARRRRPQHGDGRVERAGRLVAAVDRGVVERAHAVRERAPSKRRARASRLRVLDRLRAGRRRRAPLPPRKQVRAGVRVRRGDETCSGATPSECERVAQPEVKSRVTTSVSSPTEPHARRRPRARAPSRAAGRARPRSSLPPSADVALHRVRRPRRGRGGRPDSPAIGVPIGGVMSAVAKPACMG